MKQYLAVLILIVSLAVCAGVAAGLIIDASRPHLAPQASAQPDGWTWDD